MGIDRRKLLKGLAATSLLPSSVAAANLNTSRYLGSFNRKGENYATLIDAYGEPVLAEALPDRAHGAAVDPIGGKAVIFARRPETFGLVVDTRQNQVLQMFNGPLNRHFYGHGFFSPDGQFLYATENDFEGDRGVLGIYDARNKFNRIAELDCFGIGCHEAVLLSDGITIAVANGGISTHPDYPRQKLNLSSMRSSIAYIHRISGKKISQVFLPRELQKLSIRHLAEGPNGKIFWGGQFQGEKDIRVDILGFHKLREPINLISLPTSLLAELKQYTGSLAISADNRQLAVTCPRAGKMLVLDTGSHDVKHIAKHLDVCGVAQNGKNFIVSSGEGALYSSLGHRISQLNGAWDNHLTFIP